MSKNRYVPRRGDFIWLDFNPQKGHEQSGRRPALVLSPSEYNAQVGLVVVCPVTSEQKGYPWEVILPPGEFVSGVVLTDQVKSLDWRQRQAEFISTPADELLREVVAKTTALLHPDGEED